MRAQEQPAIQPYGTDPSQTQVTHFAELQQQPNMLSAPLTPEQPAVFDLRTMEPIAVDGPHKLLALARLGGASTVGVWQVMNRQGRPEVRVASEGFLPSLQPIDAATLPVMPGNSLRVGRPADPTEQERLRPLGITDKQVSRGHMTVTVDSRGEQFQLRDMGSANGTELVVKKVLPENLSETAGLVQERLGHTAPRLGALAASPHVEKSHTSFESDSAKSRRLRAYESIEHDTDFLKVATPYREKLAHFDAVYKSQVVALGENPSLDETRRREELAKMGQAYENAAAAVRKEFEAAVKPHLRERLRLHGRDMTAGYLEHTKVTRNPQTSRDELVNRHTNKLVNNEPPRLGAIMLPSRFSSWAGSDRQKQNELTGAKTSSTNHIVDLAAAQLAGTWQAAREKDPVVIERDYQSEAALPKEQRGLKLWKVPLGQHRIAAYRLLEGLDAPVPAAQIKDALAK